MLITLFRRTDICQSVAEVHLNRVKYHSLDATNHRFTFNFNYILKKQDILVFEYFRNQFCLKMLYKPTHDR